MERASEMAGHCLIVLVLAATFTASAGHKSAGKTPPPAAAGEFLRMQCSTSGHPSECYNALAPYADSYGSSKTKVAVGATTILLAKLDSFLAELHGLNAKEPGKYKLQPCIKMAEAAVNKKRERLAKFKELEGSGDDGKLTEKERAEITTWIDDTLKSYNGDCFPEFKNVPNVKELLPSDKGVYDFLLICQLLVQGLPTGGSAEVPAPQ
ncbi:hypothetical protein ACP4OV_027048 [Aristida adscensionis]